MNNIIDENLHATGGHVGTVWNSGGRSGTICMRLAATQLQDKRQADKRCIKGRLYIIIKIFQHWQVHILDACFWLFSWQPLNIWFGKCGSTLDDIATRKQILHVLAASCMQNGHFLLSCCENNYLNKQMKPPIKNLRICETHVLNKCYPSTLCMARSNLIRRFL